MTANNALASKLVKECLLHFSHGLLLMVALHVGVVLLFLVLVHCYCYWVWDYLMELGYLYCY